MLILSIVFGLGPIVSSGGSPGPREVSWVWETHDDGSLARDPFNFKIIESSHIINFFF
jgi:hypothetical protein